jgi:hypothetical protein
VHPEGHGFGAMLQASGNGWHVFASHVLPPGQSRLSWHGPVRERHVPAPITTVVTLASPHTVTSVRQKSLDPQSES